MSLGVSKITLPENWLIIVNSSLKLKADVLANTPSSGYIVRRNWTDERIWSFATATLKFTNVTKL